MNRVRRLVRLFAAVALPLSAAAQDGSFLLQKTRVHVQTGAAAPAPLAAGGAVFLAEAPGLGGPPLATDATVTPPGGAARALTYSVPEDVFRFSAAADTPEALSAAYPAGTYAFLLNTGFGVPIEGAADLGADAFPPAPQVGNFAAAQAVDAGADFTVTINLIPGATAEDRLAVELWRGGARQFTDTLAGNDTEYFIAADTLAAGTAYELRLRLAQLETTMAGEMPVDAGFASETRLPLVTRAGGGGGDTTPPALVVVSPPNGATNVNPFSPVAFVFSEAMDPAKIAVQWGGAADPARFGYSWQAGGTTLLCTHTGGFPDGAVTWTLNATAGAPGNFRDVAGNELPRAAGAFTVGAGGGLPGCEDASPVEQAGFTFFKQVHHRQAGPGAPQPDAEAGAAMYSVISPSVVAPPTVGGYTLEFPAPPAAPPRELRVYEEPPFGGFALLAEQFGTQAELDAAFPAQDYALQARDFTQPDAQQVVEQVVFTLPAAAYPPVPRVTNYDAAQAVNAAADFTLGWEAFTGATTNDALSLLLEDAEGNAVFEAPDACAGRPLPATATAVTIPAGTLASNRTYTASLTFFRVAGQPGPFLGATGVVASAQITRLPLKTTGGGGPAAPPVLRGFAPAGAGQFSVTVETTPGRPLTLERTAALGQPFTPLLSTNPPASPVTLTVPAAGAAGFLRGRVD
jgi:hypothetical protein